MKITHVVAAAALVASACKKKDADQATPPANNPPPAAGSNAPTPTAKAVEKAPEAPKPKTGQELVELYKQCTGFLNDNKMDDFINTCVDASYVGHESGMPDFKAADLKQHFADMRGAFPDMKFTPQMILVSGRNIFGVGLMTGTNDGPLKFPGMPEMPATHKKVGMFMTHKLALNDANKVTEEWGFADPGTMMFQLGMAPKDAPPHRAAVDKGMDLVTAVAADDAKEKANIDVAKKQNDAFNAHKAADLLALFTDDVVESDMVADKDHTGKKEIEKGLKDFLNAFSDAKVTADLTGVGDYVYSIGTMEGTNDHDMGKMKKTGKHVAVKYAEIFQLKDGKISHLWRFYSSMDFAMQMGMMPPPGAAPTGAAPKGEAPKGEAPKGDKKADKK